jgi:hypothetical protein
VVVIELELCYQQGRQFLVQLIKLGPIAALLQPPPQFRNMPSNTHPSARAVLAGLPASFPELYTFSDVVRVMEVAKKYGQPEGTPITHTPEYTRPGGPNAYVCTESE